MIDQFTSHYLISQLTENSQVTARQLHLISQGRRTASVLFNIEKNRLFSIYSLFQHWTSNDWNKVVQFFEQNNWISLDGEIIRLTEKGLSIKEAFKEEHPYLVPINSLKYAKTREDMWVRFIFINQIVSEYRYNNAHYNPYVKTIVEQQQTKKWLKKQGPSLDVLSDKWIKEVFTFLNTLSDQHASICTDLLVGHKQTGLTKRQVMEKYKLSDTHLSILLMHMMEELRCFSKGNSPLLWDLFLTVHKETDFGLSNSTYQTFKMLEDGKTILQVGRMRKLKESTIKDHIIEIVLVIKWQGYKRFIPPRDYQAIHEMFDARPDLLYSEARSVREDLEFFWFRLIEIERMRRHD